MNDGWVPVKAIHQVVEHNMDMQNLYLPVHFLDLIDDMPTRSMPGWISVKDRLPETKENPLTMDFQEVICFCDFGGSPKRTDVRTYGFGQRSWEKEPHFWHGPQIMDGIVTHWMPLPEPPKEETENE